MPAEIENPYPFPTAAEVAMWSVNRETDAARNIMARHISGIPRRPFLNGSSDHSPVFKGVLDLTTAVYRLLDAYHAGPDGIDHDIPAMREAVIVLEAMLEEHGCPPAT